jgi:hypothetical protein
MQYGLDLGAAHLHANVCRHGNEAASAYWAPMVDQMDGTGLLSLRLASFSSDEMKLRNQSR